MATSIVCLVCLQEKQLLEANDRLDVAGESEEKLAMATAQISKYREKIEEVGVIVQPIYTPSTHQTVLRLSLYFF